MHYIPSAPRILLVCDIDGTLLLPELGNPGLEEFNNYVSRETGRLIFVVNSGRSLSELADVAENGPIVQPRWLVGNVGTELYSGFSPATLDSEWQKYLDNDWGREAVRISLTGCFGLEEQEPFHQAPSKLSYYLREPQETVMPEVIRRLGPRAGSVKLITCLGCYLDIMPPQGGKGGVVAFLARRLGIPDTAVITAGDSGNDRDMLDSPWRGIVPLNHAPELDDLAGQEGVFFASRPGAAGVVEGLEWWLCRDSEK